MQEASQGREFGAEDEVTEAGCGGAGVFQIKLINIPDLKCAPFYLLMIMGQQWLLVEFSFDFVFYLGNNF